MKRKNYETLTKYIPNLKLPRRRKNMFKVVKEKEKCRPYKVLVTCNQFKSFYLCLNALYEQLFENCMCSMCPDYPCSKDKYAECMENGGCLWERYCETEVDVIINNLPIFKNKYDQDMMVCKCKPLREMDGEIVEREYLNEVSRLLF